jgi:hypothetical protein
LFVRRAIEHAVEPDDEAADTEAPVA